MRTGCRTGRGDDDGRTGLVAAILILGLAAAIVAAAATASLLDDPAGPDGPTSAGSGAGPADTAETTATTATGEPAGAQGRPVLRVGDGSSGSPGAGESSADPSSPDPTTPDSAPSSMPEGATSPSSAAAASTTSSSLTPARIQLADPDARFVTLPPGAELPSGAECALRVRPMAENVPENRTRNQTRGEPVSGTYLSTNRAIAANDYESRIDGDFVGSTDEIIQWAACKWGFDEDLLRAQVYAESTWYAGKLGDCGEATVPETGGCASVGLIQVRSAELGPTHHPGLYPQAWRSSALNLDYGLAVTRLCFEGLETWLGQTGDYRAGDHGNCMGRWFSGSWADTGSKDYQAKVRDILARRPWETWVGCQEWQSNNHCAN